MRCFIITVVACVSCFAPPVLADILHLPDPLASIFEEEGHSRRFFELPADGRLSSLYGWRKDPITGGRRFHGGIDLANLRHSVVRAAAGGKVAYAGWASSCGIMVAIDHGGSVQTRYCHLASATVHKGDKVHSGYVIGSMGATGRSTGNHLHFELIAAGRTIDPSPNLAF